MTQRRIRLLFVVLLRDYATLLALLVVCAALSVITLDEQYPTGAAAGRQVAGMLTSQLPRGASVLIVLRDTREDRALAEALRADAEQAGLAVFDTVHGQPADARRALEAVASSGQAIDAIACIEETRRWAVFNRLGEKYPPLAQTRFFQPRGYWWPNFLKAGNLLNIVNQIVVTAIVAIGLTLVIIGGGIDLSVGSLIALSAVLTARLIRDYAGGDAVSAVGLVLCSLAAIGICAAIGAVTGGLVAYIRIQPFIVTLAGMSIAKGLAQIASNGDTITVSHKINWLGRGADLWGIPNAVVLMGLLYLAAHLALSQTVFGRHLYAVGGNEKAAWLCGIAVQRIRLATYVLSAALAGLGGVIMTSTFASGAHTYGLGYELRVIAAVVVGGTSLAGGEGRMIGTLLGALLIGVVQNGMNLFGVSSQWQDVVLGVVILLAAILDRAKAAWLPR
ncbi:MAG: ABC transporter permease [Planctomycetaceae bacterium]|nr:ABC transporter permease [Planctomycetaceae bacterium]